MTETQKRIAKLTKRNVTALRPTAERYIIWDSDLKGFGLRVEPSGIKTYVVRYRVGGGRGGRLRQMTIARYGKKTPDEARKRARAELSAVADGKDPLASRCADRDAIALRDLSTRFLHEHADKKRKASTAAFYRWTLEKYVLPKLGSRKAADVRGADVSKLHSDLSETPYQANRVLSVLGSLYSWANRRGLVPTRHNPTQGIEKYPEEHRERYLTRHELDRLGAALRTGESIGFANKARQDKRAPKGQPVTKLAPHATAAIRLLLFTGARLGEILSLRWEHVDTERGVLLLPDSKTGAKVVLLNPPALAVLAGLPRIEGNPHVIAGAKTGERLTDVKRPWRAVCRHAGLSGVRLHDLRHTFASYGAAAHMGLPVIGRLLGHTQAATTARYAHLADDPLRRASHSIAHTIAAAMGEGVPTADVLPLKRPGAA